MYSSFAKVYCSRIRVNQRLSNFKAAQASGKTIIKEEIKKKKKI